MKFPAKLGACIDLAYTTRAARLEYQREVEAKIEAMKADEKAVEDHIIKTFSKSEIEAARGSLCTAAITRNMVPTKVDWPKVYAYIKRTGEFDLMEKRIAKVAWRERYEAGKLVPGTEPFEMISLSLTKIGK